MSSVKALGPVGWILSILKFYYDCVYLNIYIYIYSSMCPPPPSPSPALVFPLGFLSGGRVGQHRLRALVRHRLGTAIPCDPAGLLRDRGGA